MSSETQNANAVWIDLENSVRSVMETYSNVHRGSGQFSVVTSALYEQARKVVLRFVGLDAGRHTVAFCSPRQAEMLRGQFGAETRYCLSSEDIGLPLGVQALIVKKNALRRVIPSETGGGTARLVSREWVVWTKGEGRFEAGTPAIVNVITFARALQLLGQYGIASFESTTNGDASVTAMIYGDSPNAFSGAELLRELRQKHLGSDVLVPTRDGSRAYVNLDNAASTPTYAPILDTFCAAMRMSPEARRGIVQEVKAICARALGAPASDYDVLFTSNTTEAINLVARSLICEQASGVEPVIVNTLLEHNSNELPWRAVTGHSQLRIPADAEGIVDLSGLDELLRAYNQAHSHGKQRIRLVAVTGASNVLGTFNDLDKISKIVHEYGARLLVDGAQLVAHRRVDMECSGIDYLAFSAHKMYAPFGAGALVVKKGCLHFDPRVLASIEASGSSNAAGIAAMGKAFVLLQRIGMDLVQKEEQALTAHALERLSEVQGIRIFGINSPKSERFAQKGGVIAFVLDKCMPKKAAEELAEIGAIGVRYGCHCSHILVKRLHKIPPFLERFQQLIVKLFPKLELPGVVRVSFGLENTPEQIDALVATLNEVMINSKSATQVIPFRKRLNGFVVAVARRIYG